jgi:Major Facilitator Superfamily
VRATWRSGPLAVRSFRLLCGGQFASTIGDYCYAVALPWLVLSSQGGAILLGTVLACMAVGGIVGTLAAARTGHLRRPAIFASAAFLVEAAAIALVPYLGGAAGAAIALCVCGACNGLGNVVFLTVLQKWVSPGLLGRVMGVLMLCAFGSFPLSVAISGVLVHRLGPTPFFLVAGALIAVAILGGLTQREFRTFGASGDVAPQAASAAADPQAAEGSRK